MVFFDAFCRNRVIAASLHGRLLSLHADQLAMKQGKGFAVCISLLVTLLWSSSFVLVKFGLREIEPLMLVSVRYGVAAVILLFFSAYRTGQDRPWRRLPARDVVILGVTGYVMAQGLQVYGLYYLPAVSVTFILTFTPLLVLALGFVFLGERPSARQGFGMALAAAGVYLYFGNTALPTDALGVAVTALSGIGWACYMVYLRGRVSVSPTGSISVTALPMAAGAAILLAAGALSGSFSVPSLRGCAIILWLGVVNTALAFFLWNHALHHMRAFEQSALQNTMLIQIAVLAWLFLGESLYLRQYAGIALVFAGVLAVQVGGLGRARLLKKRNG
jgi:drug/metabolite transporter (DMT)-like permease